MKNKYKIIISIVLLLSMLPSFVYATDIVAPRHFSFNKEDELIMGSWIDNFVKELENSGVFFEVPLYLQTDYKNIPYGDYGTVATHGCGITCVAMVTAYFRDKDMSPELLANVFGSYNTKNGSLWVLFEDSAEVLNLPLQERTYDWNVVQEALQNGQVVVSLQNSDGIFTSGGHFIVLSEMVNDRVFVNDPNGKNYEKAHLVDGFKNGFTVEEIRHGESVYWIYEQKEFNENLLFKKDVLEKLGIIP